MVQPSLSGWEMISLNTSSAASQVGDCLDGDCLDGDCLEGDCLDGSDDDWSFLFDR